MFYILRLFIKDRLKEKGKGGEVVSRQMSLDMLFFYYKWNS